MLGKRTRALTNWAIHLRDNYDLNPQFIHTNKDMAEVGMSRTTWPDAKHQLCFWHQDRAVSERLAKAVLATTPYKPHLAHQIHPFIDPLWKPKGRADPKDVEGGKLIVEANSQDDVSPSNPNGLRITIPSLKVRQAAKEGASEYKEAVAVNFI